MSHLLNYKLKEEGLKITSQRKDIYNFLIKNKEKHMSAEEIQREIEKENPSLGIATIYRTLQLFVDSGLAMKHDFDDGKSRYELNTNDSIHNHHHLICQKCGKIIEVKLDLMEELEKQIETHYEFDIRNHIVKVYGICKNCRVTQKHGD